MKPEELGADFYGAEDVGKDFLGATEDVDQIDWFGDFFQGGVTFLAEDFPFVWIHRDDAVADRLQVSGYFVAGAGGVRGETYYGDDFSLFEDVGDWVGGEGGVVWFMETHSGIFADWGWLGKALWFVNSGYGGVVEIVPRSLHCEPQTARLSGRDDRTWIGRVRVGHA